MQLFGFTVPGSLSAFIQLDIIDRTSIESAHNAIADKFSKLDILVNNAGVNLEFSAGIPATKRDKSRHSILQQTKTNQQYG